MDSMVTSYPTLASTAVIGKSSEGRPLKIIRIGSRKGSSSSRQVNGRQGQSTDVSSVSNKPIFWIDAGIHAREWAAPPTALYIAYSLLSNYQKDQSVKYLLDTFDFHILPSANPDGYEYTHKSDRMWRKTRSTCSTCRQNSRCRGVDPNRNWSYHWKGKNHYSFAVDLWPVTFDRGWCIVEPMFGNVRWSKGLFRTRNAGHGDIFIFQKVTGQSVRFLSCLFPNVANAMGIHIQCAGQL